MKAFKRVALASTIGALMLSASGAQAHVYIGDPTATGAKYHLTFAVHNTGIMSAKTGDVLDVEGTGGHTDSAPTGIVDTIASKSFHDLGRLGGTAANPIYSGTYGWTHTSRWALIDLNDLYDEGHTQVKLSVKLESSSSGSGGADLIPGLTVWQAKEDAGNWSAMYVNGINSTNWGHWNGEGDCAPAGTCSYFPTLAQSAQDGKVWAAADDRNNPTGMAMITTDWITLTEGGNNYFTAVFGGNADISSTGAAKNFMATVSVQPVPVPAAVWLFGSALTGIVGFGRRKAATSAT